MRSRWWRLETSVSYRLFVDCAASKDSEMTPFKITALAIIGGMVSAIMVLILYGYCKSKFRQKSEPIHVEAEEPAAIEE